MSGKKGKHDKKRKKAKKDCAAERIDDTVRQWQLSAMDLPSHIDPARPLEQRVRAPSG